MKLVDKSAYESCKANNTDPYGAGIFEYLELWADEMERAIADGKILESVAKAAALEADRKMKCGGITGFMYGAAVSILAKYWEHGDQLRRWHNLDIQLRDEGERANESGATLNPALLSLGTKP